MTFTELAWSLPIARDIIQSAASVVQPRMRSSAPVSIAMLGLGMAMGAGVALLCTPKSGREIRREISARFAGAGHEVDDLDQNEGRLRHTTTAGA